MSIQGQVLDWRFVNASLTGIMGASGSNQNPEKDPYSGLHSPAEENSREPGSYVLIVEDNESDVFLIEEAISAAKLSIPLQVVKDGDQAVRFFDRIDADPSLPCPALVILDINLPKKQGGEVLKHMRRSRRCGSAIVVTVSTSDSAADREQMKMLGAHEYFRKPSTFDEFMKLGDVIKTLLG